jgi:plasmid stabilization system protein ParE
MPRACEGHLAACPRASLQAHLVIYDLGDVDEVIILRVRHGREDWMSSNYDG